MVEITGINIAIGGRGKLIRVQFFLVFKSTLPALVVCCKIFCGGLKIPEKLNLFNGHCSDEEGLVKAELKTLIDSVDFEQLLFKSLFFS